MATDDNGTIEQWCETPEDVLAGLRLSHKMWGSERRNGEPRWGFRGQPDACMNLIPSALRCKKVLAAGFTSIGEMTPDQVEAERLALRRFYRLADGVGLNVGAYQEALEYQELQNPTVACSLTEWPPPSLLDFMSLAQHSGIPTRLLDFTYDPLVAAYFAASSACRQPDAQHAAIWAIDLSFLTSVEGPTCVIRRINAPKFGNTFLAAQKGFFLMRSHDSSRRSEVAINKAVARMWQDVRKVSGTGYLPPPLKRLDFPVGRAADLLQLLAQEGVDEPHLMPSFQNVAKACFC